MHSDRGNPHRRLNETDRKNDDASSDAHVSNIQHEIAALAQFHAIMNYCDDAIFILDADSGRIIDVSGSACRWLGLGRDALMKMSISDFFDESVKCTTDSSHDRHEAHQDFVTVMKRVDGVSISVEIIISHALLDGRATAVAIVRDISKRRQEEERLRASLYEKEVMLKEIHHRVKNNLQVISSLLSIQSTCLADPSDAQHFHESRDRIRTMALVHEKLYQSDDISTIDFGPYVERLTANLFRSYAGTGGRINLYVDVKNVHLDADRAIPCGLIVNELVTNALKYAFPAGRDGAIKIAMLQDDENYKLIVSDDGIGIPPGFDLAETESLGLQLVNMLTSQFDGQATLDTSHGTEFTITFKKNGSK